MKTAISLPDETYERASRLAKELGVSRSEFFARAANVYLKELTAQSEIEQINAALEHLDESEDSAAVAVAAGHQTLASSDDEW